MKADQQKWDQRFTRRPLQAPSVPDFFPQQLAGQPRGRFLDLASGDGAVALWAAQQGYEVTAVDISSVGLERLQQFAQQASVEVTGIQLDLDEFQTLAEGEVLFSPSAQVSLTGFDVIAMAHFKPSVELLGKLAGLLNIGGQLMLTTFNLQQHHETGFSEPLCLRPEEFLSVSSPLHCVHYRSVERRGSFMDEYIWQLADGY